MTAVENSKRRVSFEEVAFPTLLEHTAEADRTKFSGRRGGRSHQPGTVLVLVGS